MHSTPARSHFLGHWTKDMSTFLDHCGPRSWWWCSTRTQGRPKPGFRLCCFWNIGWPVWYAVELVRRPAAGPAVGIPRLCGGYSEEVREVWAGTSLLSALVLTQTPNREEPAAPCSPHSPSWQTKEIYCFTKDHTSAKNALLLWLLSLLRYELVRLQFWAALPRM